MGEFNGVEAVAFEDAAAFEEWPAEHHARGEGVWVKAAKKASGIASVADDEPVDVGVLGLDLRAAPGPGRLDRSAPVPPMMPGMSERRTYDHVSHGITTLSAVLDVATGEVIGSIHRRHRAAESRKFPVKLEKEVPACLDVHLICDNYSTHKAPTVRKRLEAHPRFHVHFTPTYSSWLNQVERWFGLLTDERTRRGARKNLQAPERDIRSWIAQWNEDPKAFVRTKDPDETLQRPAAYLGRIPGEGR